jgi:hypothetical protein
MIDQLEQDCIIASEFGFAADAGRALLIDIENAKPDCPKCFGEGYTGGTMTMTPDGPEDDTWTCEYCGGTGKAPEMVLAKWSCPDCGEGRQDHLVCDPEDCEHITCETCKCEYYLDEMTDAEQRRESR